MQAAPALIRPEPVAEKASDRHRKWCNPSMAPSPRLPKSSQSPLGAGAFLQSLHTGAALRSARSDAQAGRMT